MLHWSPSGARRQRSPRGATEALPLVAQKRPRSAARNRQEAPHRRSHWWPRGAPEEPPEVAKGRLRGAPNARPEAPQKGCQRSPRSVPETPTLVAQKRPFERFVKRCPRSVHIGRSEAPQKRRQRSPRGAHIGCPEAPQKRRQRSSTPRGIDARAAHNKK